MNVLEGSNGQVAEDGNNIMYTPDPPSVPLRAPGLRPGDPTHAVCSSVIVFAVLLSVGDSVASASPRRLAAASSAALCGTVRHWHCHASSH